MNACWTPEEVKTVYLKQVEKIKTRYIDKTQKQQDAYNAKLNQAHVGEEEYHTVLFTCSFKGGYNLCFSSSNKVYGIIDYVALENKHAASSYERYQDKMGYLPTYKRIALIYKEIGQGEVEDYVVGDANDILYEIAGTNKWHVYMDRDKR